MAEGGLGGSRPSRSALFQTSNRVCLSICLSALSSDCCQEEAAGRRAALALCHRGATVAAKLLSKTGSNRCLSSKAEECFSHITGNQGCYWVTFYLLCKASFWQSPKASWLDPAFGRPRCMSASRWGSGRTCVLERLGRGFQPPQRVLVEAG